MGEGWALRAMLRALIYLRVMSFWNWVLTRGRRLRQPKQLAGAAMFALYLWFFFLRHLTGETGSHAGPEQAMQLARGSLPADWREAFTALGAGAMLAIATLMWVVPTQRASLGFSEAEIAFLFPAPMTRRALVHFRLLSGQFRSLVGATVMMLISNRWSFVGGNAFTHALGWWFVFSALNLHFSGATFTLTRFDDQGLGVGRRRALALAVVAAVLGATVLRIPPADRVPQVHDLASLGAFGEWITAFTGTAPLSWLLMPFRLVVGPFLAPDLRAFAIALAPALAVLVAHYLWVVKAAVAFEDASIDYATKRSARIAAWRAGRRPMGAGKAQRPPFRLAGTGRPELAFLWKNLLSAWPYFNARVFLGCAFFIAAGCLWLRSQPAWHGLLPTIGVAAGVVGVYLLVIGPQFARQDIRSDLAHADLLKTYPLPGWQLILGELLAPVAILTGLLWLVLLAFALAFHPTHGAAAWLTPGLRVVAAGWLALLTPAIVSVQLLVPNAAALVFPGWFQASRTRGGGPEIAGQRMIFFFAQMLTMVLALLPAAGFAALLIFILQPFAGSLLAVSAGALAILGVLLGEIWCGLWLLGERFDRFDLSAELRP